MPLLHVAVRLVQLLPSSKSAASYFAGCSLGQTLLISQYRVMSCRLITLTSRHLRHWCCASRLQTGRQRLCSLCPKVGMQSWRLMS